MRNLKRFTIISINFRSTILLSRTLYLFFQVTPCNQPIVVLRHWKRYGTCKPYSTPNRIYWFQYCDLIELWWSDKDLQKNAIASDIFFFNFILPALIDNPNNFEIVRLVRLVVSGMFLLPFSTWVIVFFILTLFLVNPL